ncbi:MAG: PKD domain-containing protein [Acidobacteriota bacterium]
MRRTSFLAGRWGTAAAALVLAMALMPAQAQRVKENVSNLDDLVMTRPETRVITQGESLEEARTRPSESLGGVIEAYDAFVTASGRPWRVELDRMTGLPDLMEGAGIPWIPGSANGLTGADPGSGAEAAGGPMPVQFVAARALDFVRAHAGLFAAAPDELVLNPEGSGSFSDYLYFVEFEWRYGGVPVEGARLAFRLNHGNLVQVGQEHMSPAIRSLDPRPAIDADTAWQILGGYLAGWPDERAEVVEPGRLVILPMSSPQALDGLPVPLGKGLSYRLAWAMAFREPGVLGTWEARIDAHSGDLLTFRDANQYGKVHGGVYAADQPSSEADRPLPYADVAPGSYADMGGLFSGASATSTLNGKYVKIYDYCGPLAQSTSSGDVNFGGSGGTDCATPGIGGAGNTHAARTQYYQVTLIKMKALGYLPNNSWLKGQVTDDVNEPDACNAYWDGSRLNFLRSGGGGSVSCANTGELPGVSLHEWGHGMDQNDGGGSSPDNGTGETYGDWTATLQTHSSCLGNGFYQGRGAACGGYGNLCTSCSGVRDIDWAKHSDPTPATAAQLPGASGYHCEKKSSYPGPCGYEGHCESAISSQALWDLAARDLPAWGLDSASSWQLVDRLWYLSRPTAGAAYSCSGGNTSGCNSGSLFSVFRVVDDCDGDLSNGTPHASAIYAAFNRHGIACDSAVNTDQPGCCGDLQAAILSANLSGGKVDLGWSAVPGAAGYNLYRNENGCDAGYMLITQVPAGAAAYSDSTVATGVTYYYRVDAKGATGSCTGPMSNCAKADWSSSCTLACSASAPPSVAPGASAAFSGQAGATAGCGGSPSFDWDFGDGSAHGSGASPSHSFAAAGTYTWTMTVVQDGIACSSSSTIAVAVAPAVSSMRKQGGPFRLLVEGSNLQSGLQVFINGSLWTNAQWKSTSRLILKGGSGLKSAVPRGAATQFRIVNPDGGVRDFTWQW